MRGALSLALEWTAMSSGADLFVVCKQCGAEVSPYITECPYCGSRLRRRAPKLPPVHAPSRPARRGRLTALLRGPRRARASVPSSARARASSRWEDVRPHATIVLVAVSCAAWIAARAEPQIYFKLAIVGPLHGDWWKLLGSEFAYSRGVPAFMVIVAIALFGWLLERRHGPAVATALFFGGAVTGALVAGAVYTAPVISTGNGAALALLGAWAGPDLRCARAGSYYEGDLLGAGAIGVLLLAIPFAFEGSEMSWLAGVVGGAFGLLMGLGLRVRSESER